MPCLSSEHLANDECNSCPDSYDSSSSQNSDNKENEQLSPKQTDAISRDEQCLLTPNNEYQHNGFTTPRCNQQQQQLTQMIEIPQMCEINCNTTGIYNNGLYDYEYQAMNAQQLLQQSQQTPPQYYVYHPYSEYVTGSPLLNTPVTPQQQQQLQQQQQQQQQQTPRYYTTYQTVPAPYYYDPSGAYTPTNMASPFSTPTAQPQQQPQQQQQHVISSPQQQSTILTSYQTPPPAQHQLYLTPASLSPPASMSPSFMMSNNSSAAVSNDHLSNCNSPQIHHNLPSNLNSQHSLSQASTGNQNPFLMYTPGSNPYLSQTPYQCQSPSQSFLMYHHSNQAQPSQIQSPPMVFSPFPNSPMMSPRVNSPNPSHMNTKFTPNKPKVNRYNNFNSFQKRNFNQKFNNNPNNSNMSNNPDMQTANMVFSPLESIYQNNPILNTHPPGTYDDYLNDELTQKLVDPNVTVYSPPPPQIFCDINGNLIGMPNPETGDFDAANGVTSYGDDFDNYEDSCNPDENDENLACTVCRGRRMCFCYFLKVRYYKFPSFFDLVDHQYKKWRSSIAKAKKA